MKRRLVTPKEVLDLHYAGVYHLRLPPDAIITPGAKDLLVALSFQVEEVVESVPEPVPEAGEADRAVREVVEAMTPGLAPDLRERVFQAVLQELAERMRS